MSTERTNPDTRRAARRRRGRRRFVWSFAAVLAVLVVVVTAGSVASLVLGPRLTDVEADPEAAISTSGSRVILTANQALEEVSADQVEVSPAAPFTVDAAGRSVGVRFTAPLDDDTEYRIRVPDVRGVGGGATATLETTVRTPAASVLTLERSEGEDVISRTSLSGGDSEEVFSAPEIDDFRAASGAIVVSVRQDDGSASLLRVDASGGDPVPFALPGDGTIRGLQLSESGGRIGYTYTDLTTDGETPERESQLFTASLHDPKADPEPIEVAGEAPSVDSWQFIPDSRAVLFIDFSGELVLVEPGSEAEPGILGSALSIDAIARGTYTAVVERLDDGLVWIDLATGEEEPIVAADPEPGDLGVVRPLPTSGSEDAKGVDTVRQYAILGDDGVPTAQEVTFVAADGKAREILTVDAPEALLQTCLSPSARYVAATVAADLSDNPYDTMELPMPRDVETRIVEVDTGDEVAVLPGFDASWCQAGPT